MAPFRIHHRLRNLPVKIAVAVVVGVALWVCGAFSGKP